MATETTPVADLSQRFAGQVTETVIPNVIEVVLPFSTGTVDEALAEIRDGVSGDRNTLAKLSDAVDATVEQAVSQATVAARRASLTNALIFG